jgi:hypothetical protein
MITIAICLIVTSWLAAGAVIGLGITAGIRHRDEQVPHVDEYWGPQ